MNGSLTFRDGHWIVQDLPAHVSIRFKRMFGGIPVAQLPPFVLKDAPDRATDLDWFMQRFPLEMDPDTAGALADRVERQQSLDARISVLRSSIYRAPELTGFRDGEAPHAYQRRAADMLRQTGRLLLLDDVGLGKTVSALAAIADGWGLPAAIIVQPHVATQWIGDYITRFTKLRVVEVKDRQPRSLPEADVYLFRYSNVGAWADVAPVLGCRTVIMDEIQELRAGRYTEKGKGCQALCAVAENRLGLTATPVYNYGSEIFNVMQFIAPGALGSWDEFTANWCRQSGTHWVVREPSALGSFLQGQGYALRRTCADAEVALTLPPQSRVLFEVDWDDGAVASDAELRRNLALRVLNGSFTERGSAARELDLLIRQETGIAKARAAATYARMLVESSEPVILAGWHREVYRIWNDALADLKPVMFTGTETVAAKERSKAAILSGETDVLIMSLRSGAGLDGLQQRIAHVIIAELDWSPQVHVQLIGRVARQGQTRPVTAHYLWTDGGSDPVVIERLGLKASQARGIVDPFAGAEEATPIDESRMRALAKAILEQENVDA